MTSHPPVVDYFPGTACPQVLFLTYRAISCFSLCTSRLLAFVLLSSIHEVVFPPYFASFSYSTAAVSWLCHNPICIYIFLFADDNANCMVLFLARVLRRQHAMASSWVTATWPNLGLGSQTLSSTWEINFIVLCTIPAAS